MPDSSAGVPALVACLVVPLLGPILLWMSRRTPVALAILDGFMVVAIAGLVLVDILPHSFEIAGWPVVLIALCGIFVPTLLERARMKLGAKAHRTALVLAIAGLLLHSAMDGAGLSFGSSLSLALILHRLPVGLAIWVLLRRTHGIGAALGAIVLLDLATYGGFHFATHLDLQHGLPALHWFVALVAGSLLHVVVHMPAVDAPAAGRWHWASGLGALLAIVALIGLFSGEGHSHSHAGLSRGADLAAVGSAVGPASGLAVGDLFIHLALESAPVLLLAYLAAGLLYGFMPSGTLGWLGRGRSTAMQAIRGVVFGLPIPVCSCGVVPIYRSMIVRGAPVAAALSVLVAAPELGLDSVLLSGRLLGTDYAIARVVAAGLLAVLAAWIVAPRPKGDPAPAPVANDAKSLAERLRVSLRNGLGETVDHTAPWILLGLALAACTQPLLQSRWLGEISPVAQVPIFALVGLPVYVCAAGATPLVAVFLASGVSPGAALAFLLTGPATNITTFGVLSDLHGRRFALRFALSVALLAVIAGYTVDLCRVAVDPLLSSEQEPSAWSWTALAGLALLFSVSLLRQGPRAFVAQVLVQSEDEESGGGDHGHGHRHDHDHCHC
ncbi:MAG: permease [Planctomycetes bacterium]|nr:permease [Planctomycetota bacterium]